MSDPTFAQPERRSFVVPILLAVVALAVAAGVAIHFFPATTVNIEHVHTELLPTTTVFKADSIVVGQNEIDQTLFVATTVKVENGMRMPIFVDDYSLTLTDPSDAELTAKGLSKQDIASVESSFPKLTAMVRTPLLRETAIDPGKSAQGTVVFSLRVPESVWAARKSAVVKVDIYHQQSVYVTIPKG